MNKLKRVYDTFAILQARSLVAQTTGDSSIQKHLEQSRTIYTGFDPTAASLHIGNLLTIITLLHFQMGGHSCLALVGGATGGIGDPSGKTSERSILSSTILDSNVKGVESQLSLVFKNATEYLLKKEFKQATKPIEIINNLNWFQGLTLLDFMAAVGRKSRVGTMVDISLPLVKQR